MRKRLMRGNDAVVCGALLAGCQAYFGYPITPASEIAETASRLFPLAARTFIQAESETASINMVYGASAAGVRAMTASSGPGISLMMEGVSYLAGAELPAVIVDIQRAGPGLGNIFPEQGDYNQVVKGGGHGNYRCIVLAPNSVQEMCDFTMLAFELADRYRGPVFVLSDGYVGQMMEPLTFPEPVGTQPPKPWALTPEAATNGNAITSIYIDVDTLERHNIRLQELYARIAESEVRFECTATDDAEVVLVGYGITSRILQSVVETLREDGVRVGLFRPITLWPFPSGALAEAAQRAGSLFVVELSNGQMLDDVRLAVGGRCPVHFHSRVGGAVPSVDEIIEAVRKAAAADRAGR